VVSYNHTSILHNYDDIEPQIFWGHDLDLLGSRDHLTRKRQFPIDGQKCSDHHFGEQGSKLRDKISLWVGTYSSPRDTCFKLLAVAIGHRASLLWSFPLKMHYGGWEIGVK